MFFENVDGVTLIVSYLGALHYLGANQWTGFHMITASTLSLSIFAVLELNEGHNFILISAIYIALRNPKLFYGSKSQ